MIKLNGCEIKASSFPNGESYIDINMKDVLPIAGANVIHFKFENDCEIFNLMCIKDYVDEIWHDLPCDLIMPYIPYSRMDRWEENRLFSLKTFAKLINSMKFSSVTVWEPHSEVSVALFDRLQVLDKSVELALIAMRDELGLGGSCWLIPSDTYTKGDGVLDYNLEGLFYKAKKHGIYFVFPDAGAEKRYSKQIKYSNTMSCRKERDFNSGEINHLYLNNPQSDCRVAIIVDDLCSKGGTFMGVARELYKKIPDLEKIILCVTHCEPMIFEGEIFKSSLIDNVYTTDTLFDSASLRKANSKDYAIRMVVDNYVGL